MLFDDSSSVGTSMIQLKHEHAAGNKDDLTELRRWSGLLWKYPQQKSLCIPLSPPQIVAASRFQMTLLHCLELTSKLLGLTLTTWNLTIILQWPTKFCDHLHLRRIHALPLHLVAKLKCSETARMKNTLGLDSHFITTSRLDQTRLHLHGPWMKESDMWTHGPFIYCNSVGSTVLSYSSTTTLGRPAPHIQ